MEPSNAPLAMKRKAAATDAEEACWLALLIAYIGPRQGPDAFADIAIGATVNQGAEPVAVEEGAATVTVSWEASTLSNGVAVDGPPGPPPTTGMKPNRRINRDNGVMLVSRPSA